MELVDHHIELPTAQTKLVIHLITDVHREAVGCDSRKFKRDIARIEHANSTPSLRQKELHYWFGGGDFNNGIGPKDRRFDAMAVSHQFRKHDNLHMEVAGQLVKELTPIRDYCLGYGRGNHEDGVIKYCSFDPAAYVAEKLNVNYIGYSAGIRLVIGIKGVRHKKTIIVYWHHGFGASRSKGGKLNMLYALRDKLEADVYMTGHIHEPLAFPAVRLGLSTRGKLRQVVRPLLFVNGGTYQKHHTTDGKAQTPMEYNEDHEIKVDYAEKAAYDPAVIGHQGWQFEFQSLRNGWGYKLRARDFR